MEREGNSIRHLKVEPQHLARKVKRSRDQHVAFTGYGPQSGGDVIETAHRQIGMRGEILRRVGIVTGSGDNRDSGEMMAQWRYNRGWVLAGQHADDKVEAWRCARPEKPRNRQPGIRIVSAIEPDPPPRHQRGQRAFTQQLQPRRPAG